MTQTADVIVIGLGAVGAASAWQLARRGQSVIGFDRHHPPHDRGSSHGASRITRQAIAEGEAFVPLALRAHDLWREIEAETGEALMLTTGVLVIGRPDIGADHTGRPEFVRRTLAAAVRHGVPHETLTPAEATHRFPAMSVRGDVAIYFEPGGGLLSPERCVEAQLNLASRYGADLRPGETVLSVTGEGGGVRVTTEQGDYAAAQAVVCAGAWTAGLLGGRYAERLTVWRQVMHWFAPDDPAPFRPDRFPAFIWMHGAGESDWFYGFPQLPGEAGVKVAAESFAAPMGDPCAHTQDVDPAEPAATWAQHIGGRVRGLTDRCVGSKTCMYTMAPDSRFLVGRDPETPAIIVASACSGHGFKHSGVVGDLIAQLAIDTEPPPLLAPFAIGR